MHSLNEEEEKKNDYLKNMHFGVKKKSFFRNTQISPNLFFLILLARFDFWKVLIWTSCSPYLETVSKGPWTQKNIIDFESITYSVKQRENVFAGPKFFVYLYIFKRKSKNSII